MWFPKPEKLSLIAKPNNKEGSCLHLSIPPRDSIRRLSCGSDFGPFPLLIYSSRVAVLITLRKVILRMVD